MSESRAADFAAKHANWHESVEAQRTAPFGPLSPVALHWLTAEPQVFANLPGRWSADSSGEVSALLRRADGVTRDGEPVISARSDLANSEPDGTEVGGAKAEGTEVDDADVLVRFEALRGIESIVLGWGQQRLELAARSGSVVLRPRDPQSPDHLNYSGTKTFPAHERWVVPAHFTPVPREDVEVDSAAGVTATGAAATQHYPSPGRAEFEIDGQPLSLTLFGSHETGDLRAVFADATGSDLTFPAARFVRVELTTPDTVVIDFNRATNPPCAYSASATCPFPPPENRLPVRIEAGELRPGAVLQNEVS